jgi:hypothetical protein
MAWLRVVFVPLLLCPLLLHAGQSGPPSSGQQTAQEPPAALFRTETNLALVSFQVISGGNAFISDLSADEIELREDGIPQKIAMFEGGRFYPHLSSVEIHLLFDCSGSVQKANALDPHVFSANLLNEFPNVSVAVWGFSERTLVNLTAPTRTPAGC